MHQSRDVMTVSTYETTGSIKAHSFLEFIDLNDLKSQLKLNGYKTVHLREFGAFDDHGYLVKQDIAIDDIKLSYINWCNAEGVRHLEISKNQSH